MHHKPASTLYKHRFQWSILRCGGFFMCCEFDWSGIWYIWCFEGVGAEMLKSKTNHNSALKINCASHFPPADGVFLQRSTMPNTCSYFLHNALLCKKKLPFARPSTYREYPCYRPSSVFSRTWKMERLVLDRATSTIFSNGI